MENVSFALEVPRSVVMFTQCFTEDLFTQCFIQACSHNAYLTYMVTQYLIHTRLFNILNIMFMRYFKHSFYTIIYTLNVCTVFFMQNRLYNVVYRQVYAICFIHIILYNVSTHRC